MEIASGLVTRLQSRANKSKSKARVTPLEYANHPPSIKIIDEIVDVFMRRRLDLSRTMYFASLRLLEMFGEVELSKSGSIEHFDSFHSWRRTTMKNEFAEWREATVKCPPDRGYQSVYRSFKTPEEGDFLGLLYQSLCSEGNKSNSGSYYTPTSIVRDSLECMPFSGLSFLDPCCGAGSYLVEAIEILKLAPERLIGIDNDEIATRIARINFLMALPAYDSRPNIYCLDTLTEVATGGLYCETNHLLGAIDFVATNPPWGSYKNAKYAEHPFPELNSNEGFALFLAKSLALLNRGGILSFILPESILKIRTHGGIRQLILKSTKILRIAKLGRRFSGVFTQAIRLDLMKEDPPPAWLVTIEDECGNTDQVEQERFGNNVYCSFDIGIKSQDDGIIEKLFNVDHVTLSENAEWALGIVTGDNKKHVYDSAQEGMEGVFRGSDISPFRLRGPQKFVYFNPESFQQVAKEHLYRAPEKLVYKFISNSLSFALDDEKRLTLNSANILIPHLPGLSTRVALAFLNSHVFQYIFMKKCATHKVLRGDLERFPFPKLPNDTCRRIEAVVDSIHAGEDKLADLQLMVYSTFGLSEEEIQVVRNTVRRGK